MAWEHPVLEAFHVAAARVPAYRQILADAGCDPAAVRTMDDFRRLVPVLDKQMTFGRFPIAQLCLDGQVGQPALVLTSSGQSGLFSIGLYDAATAAQDAEALDEALDSILQVRSKKTLLINCLPMGVRVPSRACTVGDVSVREDMAVALVKHFASHYEQIILVGDAVFIKLVLEFGQDHGVDWKTPLIHLFLGEEPLAENARIYFGSILATNGYDVSTGMIGSSMGVGELGLNLFFELPPLIALRRRLHLDPALRARWLGPEARVVPMIFTYDPRRILVEVLSDGRLVVSMLDPSRRVPMLRYATSDRAGAPDEALLRPALQELGFSQPLPVIFVHGRCAADAVGISVEEVKEAIYADHAVARLLTGAFVSQAGRVYVQLSDGCTASESDISRLIDTLNSRLPRPVNALCRAYGDFPHARCVDYERKLGYVCPS